jgi:Transglutaminase-like superfamily/PPR repeat
MSMTQMTHSRTIWRWLGALSVVAAICLSPASSTGQEIAKSAQSETGAVADWQNKPISGFILKEPAVVYTEPSFTNFLSQKLTPGEIALVNNPLSSTPEMNEWTRKITTGMTNDLQKAKIVFEEMVRRMRGGPGGTRTAQESFAAWRTPTATFRCQEYAELYVALARAAGLQSYYVEVIKQYGGATLRHSCAAVLVDGKALLVDPAIPWFGVAHPVINVTDDVEAIAEYMAQTPELRQKAIAYKLAPELSAVQSGYYFGLTSEGQWDEAKKVLDAMPRWNTDEWVTNMAQGQWALHEGKPAVAVTVLEKAIQANPYVGVCRRMLGDALVQQGKLHEALDVYNESLQYIFDDFNAESVREAIAHINELVAARNKIAATNQNLIITTNSSKAGSGP